jgi:hypothetical protein
MLRNLRRRLIPSQAKIQFFQSVMDSGLRGNNELRRVAIRKNIPFGNFALTSESITMEPSNACCSAFIRFSGGLCGNIVKPLNL